MIFKKKGNDAHILSDRYLPARLPQYGQHQEGIIPAGYSLNDPAFLQRCYANSEEALSDVLSTLDSYSSGGECDGMIETQIEHLRELHETEGVHVSNQLDRIEASRATRKAALNRQIEPLREKADQLESEIRPLAGLQRRFFHIGPLSAGTIVTILALIADFFVNYSFLQSVIRDSAVFLVITTVTLCLMSDASMWALGLFHSGQGSDRPKRPALCIAFLALFLLSIVTTILIRFGSMANTFGTISADGGWLPKEGGYTLAEWGATLGTAFVTAATGILSFAFSYSPNDDRVRSREKLEHSLRKCRSKLEPLLCEMSMLEGAPDLRAEDARNRAAALRHLETLELGLKQHARKILAIRMNDPTFTEKMAAPPEHASLTAVNKKSA